MNDTKRLTEVSLLSSLFIVCTIIAVGSGIGYTLYLDFIVPVFFCIVALKCGLKYSMLSGVGTMLIVGLILGDIGTVIWASQSVILGIMCGVLLTKPTTIMDDLVYGSIIGVLVMVFIDVYASVLIGYSFMSEFREFADGLRFKQNIEVIYYLFIATFPLGMVFTIYYVALILSKRLRILQGNSLKKLNIIRNFKTYSRLVCCSKSVFYSCGIYILLVEIFKILNINIDGVYLVTVIIAIQYLSMYFVIRDGYVIIQNYILSKYQKVSYARISTLIIFLSLITLYKITIGAIIALNVMLDYKIDIREKQNKIINGLVK